MAAAVAFFGAGFVVAQNQPTPGMSTPLPVAAPQKPRKKKKCKEQPCQGKKKDKQGNPKSAMQQPSPPQVPPPQPSPLAKV